MMGTSAAISALGGRSTVDRGHHAGTTKRSAARRCGRCAFLQERMAFFSSSYERSGASVAGSELRSPADHDRIRDRAALPALRYAADGRISNISGDLRKKSIRKCRYRAHELMRAAEVLNLLILGEALAIAARERKETGDAIAGRLHLHEPLCSATEFPRLAGRRHAPHGRRDRLNRHSTPGEENLGPATRPFSPIVSRVPANHSKALSSQTPVHSCPVNLLFPSYQQSHRIRSGSQMDHDRLSLAASTSFPRKTSRRILGCTWGLPVPPSQAALNVALAIGVADGAHVRLSFAAWRCRSRIRRATVLPWAERHGGHYW